MVFQEENQEKVKMNQEEWFENNKDKFSLDLNGYLVLPMEAYDSTLPFIHKNGKVIDLGCGNGMLLKFLMEFSGHELTPYGIDNKEALIAKAKEELLDFKDNFKVDDVKTHNFSNSTFDIIITNPFYTRPNMKEFTKKCIEHLNTGGRIIFRVHNDVLEKNNIKDITEVNDFKDFNMKITKNNVLTIGIIDKV